LFDRQELSKATHDESGNVQFKEIFAAIDEDKSGYLDKVWQFCILGDGADSNLSLFRFCCRKRQGISSQRSR
jgi:hypothetical protein